MSTARTLSRPAAVVALLGVALCAALGAWVLMGHDRDRPLPPKPLPVPRPPRDTPLSSGRDGGGRDPGGWRWVNPLPRALPTWNDIDVSTRGRVAIVGKRGAAARVDPRGLWLWPSGSRADLHGVAWLDDDRALVAGDDGTLRVLHVHGGSDAIEVGGRTSLRAVALLGDGRALVAGDGGVLLAFAAGRTTSIVTHTRAALLAIHAGEDATWVVGEHGTILLVRGTAVSAESAGSDVTLRAVAGCAPDSLYAAGDDGRVLRRTAQGWRVVPVAGHETWTSATCEGDRVAVSGTRGGVLLLRGDAAVRLDSGSERAWNGISHATGEGTWVVGVGGRMAGVREDHLELLSSGPTAGVRDIATLGGALVAVGEYGRVFFEREAGMREVESPTEAGLGGIAALAEDRLVAVGDEGAVVEIGAERLSLRRSPTRAALRDVVAAGGRMLAVGTEGTLVEGTLAALAARRIAGVGDLWAVAGTPSDAIAVGVEATVLRIGASATARVPCEAGHAALRALVRTPAGVWAVGDSGTIVRVETGRCVVEHVGGPTLHGIGLGPHGEPFAVGEQATALARAPDGTWTPVPFDAGDATLRAVMRTDRYVYVVGTGGLVLRHIQLE